MMEWLLLLLFIGPAIYLYGCKMQRDMDKVEPVFQEQSAYYHIPGLEGSDIHESDLEKLR